MSVAELALDHRVEARNRRAGRAAGGDSGEADRSAGTGRTRAGGSRDDTLGDSPQRAPGLRPLQIRCRLQRPVSLDCDVEIILQGQRDGVLQGEIDIAGAYQALQTIGIRQVGRRNSRLPPGTGESGEGCAVGRFPGDRRLGGERAQDGY